MQKAFLVFQNTSSDFTKAAERESQNNQQNRWQAVT